MNVLAWIVAATLAATLCAEAIRRLPPRVGALLFVAIPLAATPLWLTFSDTPLFSFTKVYSICAGLVYIELLKATRWSERQAARLAGYLLLAINILEAVVADAVKLNAVNAAAGVLLVLAQAYPGAITVDRDSFRRDLRYQLGGWWVAAYTVWNFAFVYGCVPSFAAFALVHLAAPILACRGRSELWLQARVAVLSVMMIVRMSAPNPPFLYLVPHWYSPPVATALHVASLGMAIVVAARSFREARRTGVRRDLLGSSTGLLGEARA